MHSQAARLLCTTVIAGLAYGLATPAVAQSSPAEVSPAEHAPSPAVGQQPGQDAAATSNVGDPVAQVADIVVTAQRRQQNLQDVPVSIAVVTGEALAKTGFRSITDLQYVTPGLQYNPGNGGQFQIRGVGTQGYDFSTEQAVSVVIDNVVMDAPRDPGLIGLNDIDRVEVLRGPQGTLFGKNSTSGVVSIVTRNPVLGELSGGVSANYGERNDYNVNGVANLPIGDAAALRITAFAQGQDGNGRNTFLKQDIGTFREAGVRAKLLVEPLQGLRITLLGDFGRHHDNAVVGTFQQAVGVYASASLANGVTPGKDNYDTADRYPSNTLSKSYGGSAEIGYQLGAATLTSITAYRRTELTNDQPSDLLPDPLYLPVNISSVRTRKFSEELRLASRNGGFFEYLIGAYYNRINLYSTADQWGQLGLPLPPGLYLALTGAAGTTTNQNVYRTVKDTKALFGQATFNFTNRLSLALGGRLTRDENTQGLTFATSLTADLVMPVLAGPTTPQGTVKKTNFSYSVHPQFKVNRDVLAYLTYSTGYKGPGVSFVSNVYSPYKSEKVANYEAGIKSELFSRRLRLNAAVFYEKFSDFQAQTAVPQAFGLPVFVIGNAGALTSKGFEVDSMAVVVPGVTIDGAVSYANSKYTDYNNGVANYTGQPLPGAPRWTYNLAANVDRPISPGYRISGTLTYSHRSSTNAILGDNATRIDSYGLVGARVAVGSDKRRWQVGAYARNLLNEHFRVGYYDFLAQGVGLLGINSPLGSRTIGGFATVAF